MFLWITNLTRELTRDQKIKIAVGGVSALVSLTGIIVDAFKDDKISDKDKDDIANRVVEKMNGSKE